MFLVFAGDNYYPGGGYSDFVAKTETVKEAKELAHKYLTRVEIEDNVKDFWMYGCDWAQVCQVTKAEGLICLYTFGKDRDDNIVVKEIMG